MQNHSRDRQADSADSERGALWKSLAPWMGAVIIVLYLFWQVPLAEVWAATGRAELEWFVPLLLLGVIYWFLLDSLAYAYLISRLNAPISWKESRAMRGITYLAAAINWNIGNASIVLYLRRYKQIPPLESTSSILFYMMFDGFILAGLAFLGASFFPESAAIQRVQWGAGAVLLGNILFLVVVIANGPRWSWLTRLRSGSVLRSFRQAIGRDFVVLFAIRMAYFAGFLGIFLFGAQTFGVEVPLMLGLASVPVIMMAGALPITPAGIGTQAAAMLFFWSGTGDSAAIVAFGLVLPIGLTGTRVLVGLPYLRDFRLLRRVP